MLLNSKPFTIAHLDHVANKKFHLALFYLLSPYNLLPVKELLKSLITAQSTSEKGELQTAEIIRRHLADRGITSLVTSWDENRANIVAHIKSARYKPALLFVCHLDVVPPGEAQWKYPPFAAVEKDGKIYGRGSADMKGPIAALVTAIEKTVSSGAELKGDILFVAAAGEETDSCGIKRFLTEYKDTLPRLAGIIVPEPTNFEVITAHRGLLWLEVITKGRAAHGSMPHLGVNAIKSMRLFLDELERLDLAAEKHNLLGDYSMSVNTISAGKAVNVVPDLCTVRIDMRTLPKQNHAEVISKFRAIFDRLKPANPDFDAEVRAIRDVQSLETDSNCEFVKEFCLAINRKNTTSAGFCTDGPFLAPLGAPIVIFGPGRSELAHKPDEYIELANLEKGAGAYTAILRHFLR